MTISAICPNGHKIKAKDSLAGKRVACPKCAAKFAIPTPEPELAREPELVPGPDEDSPIEPELEPLGGDPLGSDPLGSDPLGGDPLGGDSAFDLGSLDDPLLAAAPAPQQSLAAPSRPAPSGADTKPTGKSGGWSPVVVVGAIVGAAGLVLAFVIVLMVVVMFVRSGDTETESGGSVASVGDKSGKHTVGTARPSRGPALQTPLENRPSFSPLESSDAESIVTSELVPEDAWSIDTERVKPDAATPLNVEFRPRAWAVDETGQFMAVLGARRVTVMKLPDFSITTEIGCRETPRRVAIGPKYLALVHADGVNIEVIEWRNGKSIGIRKSSEEFRVWHDCLVIRGGHVAVRAGQFHEAILKLSDLSVPTLVGQIVGVPSATNRITRIVPRPPNWYVAGAELNASMDQIVHLPYVRLPGVVPVGTSSSRGEPSDLKNVERGLSLFARRSSKLLLSPGGEYAVLEQTVRTNNLPTTYFLDYYETYQQRQATRSQSREESPLGRITLLRSNAASVDATLIDGLMIIDVIDNRKESLGLLYVDLKKTELPPRLEFDSARIPPKLKILSAPIELIPGQESTIRIRIPQTMKVISLSQTAADGIQRTIEGDIVTVVIDNDQFIKHGLDNNNYENQLTFRDFAAAKKLRDASSKAVIDAYRDDAVATYERITGFKAVGVPVIVAFSVDLKIEGPPIHSQRVLWQMFWQLTEEQAQWMTKQR